MTNARKPPARLTPLLPLTQFKQSFKNISYSPLRMNIVAKGLRRLTVPEALAQASLSVKKGGMIAHALIEKASAMMLKRHGLPHEALVVDELTVLTGPGQKRVKIMGRGRTGIEFIRSSHMNGGTCAS